MSWVIDTTPLPIRATHQKFKILVNFIQFLNIYKFLFIYLIIFTYKIKLYCMFSIYNKIIKYF